VIVISGLIALGLRGALADRGDPRARRLATARGEAGAGTIGPGSTPSSARPSHEILHWLDISAPGKAPSPELELRLGRAIKAAREAGAPVKVALIDSREDMEEVEQYMGRPAAYARVPEHQIGYGAGGARRRPAPPPTTVSLIHRRFSFDAILQYCIIRA
jgi:hypothetical protein